MVQHWDAGSYGVSCSQIVWHNQGVSQKRGGSRQEEGRRRALTPLDPARLEELALRYVSRFATTQAKLQAYLKRKLRERGWEGQAEPDLERLSGRFVEFGYINDAAFARAKATALIGRGYGSGRVRQALTIAGVSVEDSTEAREVADDGAVDSALRFARRRRLGPFAAERLDPAAKQKALAAMLRAGHSFRLAKLVLDTPPGEELDPERL